MEDDEAAGPSWENVPNLARAIWSDHRATAQ
jgi:hypothetical protein